MKLKNFLVRFNYIKDMEYLRIPVYKEHINYYKNLKIPNLNLFGGSLFPYTGSYIFIESENNEIVEKIIKDDPFYKSNLVTNYDIKEFNWLSKKSFTDLTKEFSFISK